MKRILLLTIVALLIAAPAPAKTTLCHFGETKQVPAPSVPGHLDHGDYLGPCETQEPTPPPDDEPTIPPGPSGTPGAHPLYHMWLLTREGWDCLIRSTTHPSEERQRALCFRGQYPSGYDPARLRRLADENRRLNGWWVADNSPCNAPVMSDGTWACDKYTPWRNTK